jgi:hypothetical protein
MFACIANWPNGGTVRTSFHSTLAKARERAEHNLGVIAIEEIGVGIVWKRSEQ